jgi:hypothetical protein
MAGFIVKPIQNEIFRYHVNSRTPGVAPYFVDLECYDWNGKCDCWPFRKTFEKKLRLGYDPCPGLQCWHIRACLFHFMRTYGPRMAEVYYGKLSRGHDQ